MAIALGALLALVSVAAVAYPFLGLKQYRLLSRRFASREKIRAERLQIYRKIIDLGAERSSGDLTEVDFKAQRDQLRVTAAELLRQESGSNVEGLDHQLEREISRMREQSARPPAGGGLSR